MQKQEQQQQPVQPVQPEVIAHRQSCAATGTGLSHYILVDKGAKK